MRKTASRITSIGIVTAALLMAFGIIINTTEYVDADTRYLPITYEHIRYEQEDGKGSDIWYTIIPAKYKMHYSYAEDKLFGREIHSASCIRHGATLAVNTQFLGYPIIDGERPVPDANMSLSQYDFYITQNENPTTAYDVFDVHVTTDPTDTRAGISFRDIDLGFDYDGDHVPHENCFGVYNGEIYMALFAQIIKNGQVRETGTPYLTARHPRTWIAYDYEGNQFVATAAGRNAPLLDGTSRSQLGLRYDEMVDVTREYMPMIKTMYNLDGGGSSSFVYRGEKLSPHYNTNSAGERYERKNYGTYYWKVETRKVTTRHLIKGTDTKLAEDTVEIMYEGDEYSTQPIEKDHYRVSRMPDNATGMLEGNVVVTYYYELDHDLINISEVAATCTEDGNIEYWKCETCKRCYRDKNAVYEVDEDETVVEKRLHSLYKVESNQATCLNEGNIVYWRCGRCDRCFEDDQAGLEIDVKDAVTEKVSHDWTEITYLWSSDNSEVTAFRICSASPIPHIDIETVSTTSCITNSPGCTMPGRTTYTADFENPGFETQTKTVEDIPIDPDAHDEDGPSFEWSGDRSTVTGKVVCKSNGKHVLSETVNTVSEETVQASCTEPGIMIYTAVFSDSHFGEITSTETIPAKGHDIEHFEREEATCTGDGSIEYWKCRCCGEIFHDERMENRITDRESLIIPPTGHLWDTGKITRSADAEASGEKTYTCTICGMTKNEIIPKHHVSGILLPSMKAKGKRSLVISWNRVQGVDGYDIFFAKNGKNYKVIRTIEAGSKTSYKWKTGKLKARKCYRAYVRAYKSDGDRKIYLVSSPKVVAYTSGGTKKYTNPLKIKVKKSSKILAPGKSFRIKATVKKPKKKTKKKLPTQVSRVRYLTDDAKIATVDGRGKVTAITNGTCRIYVFAANGIRKTVTVNVK